MEHRGPGPGKEVGVIMEELADYFSSISQEFQPLQQQDIPRTYDREIHPLTPARVAERLRTIKTPTSTVPGDIPPDMIAVLADQLSVPLA